MCSEKKTNVRLGSGRWYHGPLAMTMMLATALSANAQDGGNVDWENVDLIKHSEYQAVKKTGKHEDTQYRVLSGSAGLC